MNSQPARGAVRLVLPIARAARGQRGSLIEPKQNPQLDHAPLGWACLPWCTTNAWSCVSAPPASHRGSPLCQLSAPGAIALSMTRLATPRSKHPPPRGHTASNVSDNFLGQIGHRRARASPCSRCRPTRLQLKQPFSQSLRKTGSHALHASGGGSPYIWHGAAVPATFRPPATALIPTAARNATRRVAVVG